MTETTFIWFARNQVPRTEKKCVFALNRIITEYLILVFNYLDVFVLESWHTVCIYKLQNRNIYYIIRVYFI